MANISHFTQTVNGVSTTYDIHDAGAVDLTNNQTVAGDKEFTGTTTAHDVVPSATDTYNLGSSTNKWKSFNGINPGALSLPSTTGLIDIRSSITSLDGVTVNTFTPQVDGWLLVNGRGLVNNAFISVAQGRIGAKGINNEANDRCAVLIPVVAGVEVNAVCKLSSLTWANIVPCQGNI